MKIIAQVKLLTTDEQADALKRTIECANAACDYISEEAWALQCFNRYALQKVVYYQVREHFPDLSSQIVIRCIAKVADAYRVGRHKLRRFKPYGAISYDQRSLSWRTKQDEPIVSIQSVDGRLKIPVAMGEHQKRLIENGLRGAADLIYRDGVFYLHQVCEVETPDPDDPDGWLGVDLGIKNLAVDSDGTVFSGAEVEAKRRWYEKRRAILQSVGTKSAKRRLRQMAGKLARFQRHVNHCISKALVGSAKRTGRGIALEDLTGIRTRTRVNKQQRTRRSNWAFYQLRTFVQYKGLLAGVPVQLVDPRNTSKTCPLCGHVSRTNRRSRDWFACACCGFAAPADHVAAINVAARATVDMPMGSTDGCKGHDHIVSTALPLEVRANAPSLVAG